MGRLTSETHPESGTTTYVYDTDSTCGASSGDRVKKTDAIGNVSCYAYDSLHRPTAITYPSGSYAAVTPAKHFVYDSATVNGQVMSNVKTRLAEAYTCISSCTTKLTDTGFSYTVRGEPSDAWQSTPNSAGYYHLSTTYWANGAPDQLGNNITSLPAFTFAVDGEGRPYKASASSGQNPVTNTVFNAASLATSVTYGSGDADSFSYDPNTNRLTQYQFTVNGQSETGALTWNADHTLQSLDITDPFNSPDTQNCAYSHDDLTRLASVNCGTPWSQTFSYDAFGNISKSGTYTFQPIYKNSSGNTTNQFVSIPGATVSYDANGNVLTDGSHTYAWDSSSKAITVDSVNATYDALGRMVEQNRSGAHTQFAYGPTGAKLAILSGQTLQKGLLPLPGGGVAVYNSSGLLYYGHPDHLGSIRLGSTPSRAIAFDIAYAPFGETYAASGTTDPAFTGQRQDTVAGLYDFPDRQYSTQGRWPAPDPAGLSSMHLSDPQTLNRYAYVRNNPLALVDPQGLDEADACGDEDGICGVDDGDSGGGGGGGGGGGDPSSGGDQGNSGGDCGADDPLCLGSGITNPTNPFPLGIPPEQFSSAQQAALYGSIYAYWMAVNNTDNGEWGGEVYQNANGTYSYDVGRPSDPSDPNDVLIDAGAIPDGTSYSGFYHTHGDDPSASAFFTPGDNTLNFQFANSPLFPNYQGMSVSLPNGDILWQTNNGLTSILCTGCVGP
jgi:RHS repeat-associated protein